MATPAPENGATNGRDLSKGYLPILIVIALLLAVSGLSYTVGGVMSGIERDRTDTANRFAAIETSIAKIMTILEGRASCVVGKDGK